MSDNDEERELLDVLEGLRADPPRIAPRYFYDAIGSQLFAAITGTPEYYPTRTELAVLRAHGGRVAAALGPQLVLIELGSGSADKALALLEHCERPLLYRPIDISRQALEATTQEVRRACPDLDVSPYWGDFMSPAAYDELPPGSRKLIYYSGSSIGNFDPLDAVRFLQSLRRMLRPNDGLLLGLDLVKDPDVLHAAYNDAAGLTARFNKNVLSHLNARFSADFDPESFEHSAFYDRSKRRVEMHLVPRRRTQVTIGGRTLFFDPASPIHTESSYKFTLDDIDGLAGRAGFKVADVLTDERQWFADALLVV